MDGVVRTDARTGRVPWPNSADWARRPRPDRHNLKEDEGEPRSSLVLPLEDGVRLMTREHFRVLGVGGRLGGRHARSIVWGPSRSLESRHGVAKRVLMLTACAPGYLLGRREGLTARVLHPEHGVLTTCEPRGADSDGATLTTNAWRVRY
jgi:hypothetical protein